MKKIILVSLAFLLIGGGVYSQQVNTPVPKDKKEVPHEVKDKTLPAPKDKNKVKTDKPDVDTVKNNIDTARG